MLRHSCAAVTAAVLWVAACSSVPVPLLYCFQTVRCGCTAALLHEAEEQLLADRREIMRTVPLGIAKSREWKRAVRLWCSKQVGASHTRLSGAATKPTVSTAAARALSALTANQYSGSHLGTALMPCGAVIGRTAW